MFVSIGTTNLSERTKDRLKSINKPIHIQVFVLPTCPHCPKAVRLAHQLATESDFIRADVIEATEFPHLAHKYNVMGVPKIVINEIIEFAGAIPEDHFIEHIMLALHPSMMYA
ncbi:MAG: thioredoxin family protein [Euryarchaeota archaeon]|nr:thioredoxin family protein [Euryarchaeota archaeon]